METKKLFGVPLHELGHITPVEVSEYIYDFFDVPRKDRCVDKTTTQFSFISHDKNVDVFLFFNETDDGKPYVYGLKLRPNKELNIDRFDEILKANGFDTNKIHFSYQGSYTRYNAQWKQYSVNYNNDFFSFYDSDIYDEVTEKEKAKKYMDEKFWSNLNLVG